MQNKLATIMFNTLAIIGITVQTFPVSADTTSNPHVVVSGNCNQTVTSSRGGIYILNCTTTDIFKQADRFKVVLGFTAKSPILDGQIDWRFVDKANSDITIYVDDRQEVYEDLDTPFQDEVLVLKRGQHVFRIETNFSYFPLPSGFQPDSADASCTVVLDVQAPGKVVPKFNIRQNDSGALLPLDCSFEDN